MGQHHEQPKRRAVCAVWDKTLRSFRGATAILSAGIRPAAYSVDVLGHGGPATIRGCVRANLRAVQSIMARRCPVSA